MRLRNLTPAILLVIHWMLVAAALIWRGGTAGLHLPYESWLLSILMLADLPPILLLSGVGIEVDSSLTLNSFWVLSLAILVISLQWLLLGVVLGRIIRMKDSQRIP